MRTLKKKPKGAGRLWWHVHHWVGLKLSLLLSFTLLTGTLAVVGHEIDWLLQPSLRVNPTEVSNSVAWDRIALTAAADPSTVRIVRIEAPVASAFAARVLIERSNGKFGYLNVHPVTGEIGGESPWPGAQRILRNIHRHLNMPLRVGVLLITLLSFLLAASLITSFLVYKKWWRGFFKPIRFKDARTAWGDFHRLSGLWSLWFILVMVLTGIWYFIEETGLDAPALPRPVISASRAMEPDYVAKQVGAAVASAAAAKPSLRVKRLIFPGDGVGAFQEKIPGVGQAFQFHGQDEAILVRPRANNVWVDVSTADVLLATDARDLGIHQRISEMADPLHFGTFGGYWSKIPWFVFGVLLTGLSVSGVTIYASRLLRKERESTTMKLALGRIWRGMGQLRWLSTALVGTSLILLARHFMS